MDWFILFPTWHPEVMAIHVNAQILRTQLDEFWKEAGISFAEYTARVPPRGLTVPRQGEWETELVTFPSTQLFQEACMAFCQTANSDELEILLEAIAIDNEGEVFRDILWEMNCHHDVLIDRMQTHPDWRVRIQLIFQLRDALGERALPILLAMLQTERDFNVRNNCESIIDYLRDEL